LITDCRKKKFADSEAHTRNSYSLSSKKFNEEKKQASAVAERCVANFISGKKLLINIKNYWYELEVKQTESNAFGKSKF
jgi:hypothetical protein